MNDSSLADRTPAQLSETVAWRPFPGFDGLYYNVLDVDDSHELVDMLMKFDPLSKCVPHRHVGPTRTLVVEGEHIMYEADCADVEVDRRPAGTFSTNSGDEMHIEGGGPNGAVILLSMTAVEGVVYEIFNSSLEMERTITKDDFRRGLDKQRAAAALLN